MTTGRYFDQWTLGERIDHPMRRTVTETDNLLISALTHNAQPLHLDAEYAAGTEFGRIVVNGMFTFALMVGISVAETTVGTLVANLGFENVTLPKPVFIGDTLRVTSEVTALRASSSRPNDGIVTFSHQAINQREEVCLRVSEDRAPEKVPKMKLRSLLFVPGDRPDRMRKALASGADALILDLEDSVAALAKPAARDHVAAFLGETAQAALRPALFVRINALDQGMLGEDLGAILSFAPQGVVLPKADGAECLAFLDKQLGLTDVAILPIVTETPKAIFQTGAYGGVTPRLCAMSWGAEDLSAAVKASTAREADGRYRPPYELARSLTLFGAHAAGVAAIETVFPNFADLHGLAAYAERGRQDGFSGMLAIHPSQVATIHSSFRPSEAEINNARRIVDLFAANPGAGALSLEGQMLDAPHLAEAKRILEAAE